MKTQNSTIPKIASGPSNLGAAQLVDNRNSTVVQRKLQDSMSSSTENNTNPIQRKNNSGLPDNLKSGIENLSGYSMDDVKVHYNSSEPAQLQAHAYAQGTDIHLASGQEKHLPHEAWHVVQQKQGRVRPTRQLKSKVNINDDTGLEKEADEMGNKAMQQPSQTNFGSQFSPISYDVFQRKLKDTMNTSTINRTNPIQLKEKETHDKQFIDKHKNSDTHDYEEIGTGEGSGVKRIDERYLNDGIQELDGYNTSKFFGEVKNYKVKSRMFGSTFLRTKAFYYAVKTAKYEVVNASTKFYHAAPIQAADRILEHGLDPMYNYDQLDKTRFSTRFNTRGFNYFSTTPQLAKDYGKSFLEKRYRLLSFTMPEGTFFESDPELNNAGRVSKLIPHKDISISEES